MRGEERDVRRQDLVDRIGGHESDGSNLDHRAPGFAPLAFRNPDSEHHVVSKRRISLDATASPQRLPPEEAGAPGESGAEAAHEQRVAAVDAAGLESLVEGDGDRAG